MARTSKRLVDLETQVAAIIAGGGTTPVTPPPGNPSIPVGAYNAYLALPDASPLNGANTRAGYALRFANTDVPWVTTGGINGYNDLGHQITIVAAGTAANTTKTYTRSMAVVLNPERGTFIQKEGIPTSNPLTSGDITTADNSSSTLFRRIINLQDFLGTDTISAEMLTAIAADCTTARAANKKLVIRFAYNYDGDNTNIDVAFTRMNTHINQLAAVINNNADAIFAIEAGFIGKWGEWHYAGTVGDTGTYGNGWWNSSNWTSRPEVIKKILQTFSNLPVTLRYPRHIYYFMEEVTGGSSALTQAEKDRLGFKHDAFLSGDDEYGTYDEGSHSTPDGRAYMYSNFLAQRARAVGGEAIYSGNFASTNALFGDFDTYNWSFLNNDFDTGLTDQWKSTDHPDATEFGTVTYWGKLQRKLGYRIVLNQAIIPSTVVQGSPIVVNFTFNNEGYEAPVKDRPMYLVLRHASTGAEYRYVLSSNPVTNWRGGTATVQASIPTVA